MRTGFIGLGAMGRPMAAHLARAGHLRAVWNRTAARAGTFAAEHGVTAPALPALAAQCDLICICVSADADLVAVIDELSGELREGQIIVDHSTVSPRTARDLHRRLTERGVAFVDAPVTGGVEGAAAGSLAVMAGGDAAAVARVRTVIETYARVLHHLGPAGSGQAAKVVNQVMVAGIAEAVCEALALMRALELPEEPMLELLAGGAAGSWFLDKRGRSMLAGRFDKGFHPALLLKDLKICAAVAGEAGKQPATLQLALADYRHLLERFPDPGNDISALFRVK